MEENVYEETTRTEEPIVGSESGKGREDAAKEASAVLGKFKDVGALARAYEALQAEFTRRSQRLKELEKRAENSAGGATPSHSGAEKLRRNAQVRKEEAKRFDEFLLSTEEVGVREASVEKKNAESEKNDQPLEKMASKVENEEKDGTVYEMKPSAEVAEPDESAQAKAKNVWTGSVEAAGKATEEAFSVDANKEEGALQFVAKSGNATASSEALYEQASRDESVRLRLIGEYLASLGKPNAPLMAGGVGTLKTPPKKADCVADAGNMALLYFQKTHANR